MTISRPTVVSSVIALAALVALGALADWWICLPENTVAQSVGRHACIECHAEQGRQYSGSHHDRAMDIATEDTVLGDFADARLTHLGVTSRMYRKDGRFMVHIQGRGGEMEELEIKYVFGVEPLQQYLVQFDRTAELPDEDYGRLQVLPVSWNTNTHQWFYLAPPDVRDQTLQPDDVLYWTNTASNWNTMCADCHSTNLRKRYDVDTQSYHATAAEIDVSCEACHGPGSTHVRLARSRSLFWDRKVGYGLARLKDHDIDRQIHTCAQCHSRRQVLFPGYRAGENYFDHFSCDLVTPETYHADGQIRDEVYVFGSYLQSKMYHKGVRCTDCHNPHTARLKYQGNRLCTSCHQHPAGKYDTPAHHHHAAGSSGASCVACHMPATTYMEVDPRRDHSLRVPRPDLSVRLGTPNACTGCHIDTGKLGPRAGGRLRHYADWLDAARTGDAHVTAELARLDAWNSEKVAAWYGHNQQQPHFADALDAAWRAEPSAERLLVAVVNDKRQPAIVRASALVELRQFDSDETRSSFTRALGDPHPMVRAAAVGSFAAEAGDPRGAQRTVRLLGPLLLDPTRLVRHRAAHGLAAVPGGLLTSPQRRARRTALDEIMESTLRNSDPVSAHMALGILYERTVDLPERVDRAIDAYRTAIRLGPAIGGPRANLSGLLDEIGQHDEATMLRSEELKLLERDLNQLPPTVHPRSRAAIQFRYGLALYVDGQKEAALRALQTTCELSPNEPHYLFVLAKLYQDAGDTDRAHAAAQRLLQLRPDSVMYRVLMREIVEQMDKR